MDWRLHWLEAEGALDTWRERITSEVEAAWQAVAGLVHTPPLDILVQRLPGAVTPEIGMVGHACRKGLFALTLDPDNPHFAASLDDGALRRQVTHEAHHCLRMAGPGYGGRDRIRRKTRVRPENDKDSFRIFVQGLLTRVPGWVAERGRATRTAMAQTTC